MSSDSALKISAQFVEQMRKIKGVKSASQSKLTAKLKIAVALFDEPLFITVEMGWDDIEDIQTILLNKGSLKLITGQILLRAQKQIKMACKEWEEPLAQWTLQFENQIVEPWRAQQLSSLKERLRHGISVNWPLNVNQILQKIQFTSQECETKAKLLWKTVHAKTLVKQASQLANYPELFPVARSMKRKWTAWLGPTNSGKTYSAFEQLKNAKNGVYLAPLRLMALEGYEKLQADGYACNLRTGEERIDTEGAHLSSSTIEMVHLQRRIEVGIIDEAQMLSDSDRGWAWTQALIGLPAEHILITGSPDIAPLLEILAAWCGEELEIYRMERKTPLRAEKNISVSEIKKGDAVVAFSRRNILMWREVLGKSGIEVACIYGALGPDVRRNEARRFRSGEASVLIATDAIGMGLNLPIERVVLTAGEKYDGRDDRELTPSEVRQIGGRAGRYGLSKAGEVVMLEQSGMNQKWLQSKLDEPSWLTRKPYIQAPWSELERIQTTIGLSTLHDLLIYAHGELIDLSKTQPTNLEGLLPFAQRLNESGLAVDVQYQYLGCPIGKADSDSFQSVISWSKLHGRNGTIRAPKVFTKQTRTSEDLKQAETEAEVLTSYLWLALRWPEFYPMGEQARILRTSLNELIEQGLRERVLKKTCQICRAPLKANHLHAKCDRCWKKGR